MLADTATELKRNLKFSSSVNTRHIPHAHWAQAASGQQSTASRDTEHPLHLPVLAQDGLASTTQECVVPGKSLPTAPMAPPKANRPILKFKPSSGHNRKHTGQLKTTSFSRDSTIQCFLNIQRDGRD